MIILHDPVDDFNGHVTAARTVALDMGMSLDMLNNHARVQAKEALQEHADLESPLSFPRSGGRAVSTSVCYQFTHAESLKDGQRPPMPVA